MPIIGRLHRVEMQYSTKLSEFDSLKPGDKIEAKVLRKIEGKFIYIAWVANKLI